jgi:hypothetical protein
MVKKLVVHKENPPMGYSWIGMWPERKRADEWYEAALKAGKDFPFWLQKKDTQIGMRYSLYWKKPHKGKMVGRGWG